MNAKQTAMYRAILETKLKALLSEDEMARDSQKTVKLDQQSVGRLSRMDALQQQAMAKVTAARRAQKRQKLTAALGRLDKDEFGYCVQCGDMIATERLYLDPTIPTCIACAKGI